MSNGLPASGEQGSILVRWWRRLTGFLEAERGVIVAFLFSRGLIWAIAWFSTRWFKPGMLLKKAPRGDLWDLFFRWDSGWFMGIVEQGYMFLPGKESNVAFFPLYPLAAGWIGHVGSISARCAGFLISNLSLLVAAIILRRIVSADYAERPRVAKNAVWFLLLTPAAVFYTAFYSESLFLALSLLSYYSALRGRWACSRIAGALLTATRSNGIVLLPALVWEARREKCDSEMRGHPLPRWRGAWLTLVPLGLGAYMAYLHFRFGDALALLKAQAAWGRALAAPWTSLVRAPHIYDQAYARLFIGCALAGLLTFMAAIRERVRISMLIYAGLMLLLALSSNLLESLPRYLSVVFPFYISVAVMTDRSEGFFHRGDRIECCLNDPLHRDLRLRILDDLTEDGQRWRDNFCE